MGEKKFDPLTRHFSPIASAFSDFMFNRPWFLRELEKLNAGNDTVFRKILKRFERKIGQTITEDRPIRSVFLVYPANDFYLRRFVYPWHGQMLKKDRWHTLPVNLFCQGGKLIYVVGITVKECEFGYNSENLEKGIAEKRLISLHEDLTCIRDQIGADYYTRAGIIPSVSRTLKINKSLREATTTIHGVLMAIEKVLRFYENPKISILIILGSRGHIGGVLKSRLPKSMAENLAIIPVDKEDEDDFKNRFCQVLKDERVLVLNIASGGALHSYMEHIPDGWIILNEAYDDIQPQMVKRYNDKGVQLLTINGLRAWVLNSLGGAYKNVIPLCAALTETVREQEIVISRITAENFRGVLHTVYTEI